MRRPCLTVFASATATSKPSDENPAAATPAAPNFSISRRVSSGTSPPLGSPEPPSSPDDAKMLSQPRRPSSLRSFGVHSHPAGQSERFHQRSARLGAQPAGHRASHTLGGVGGLRREIEDRLELVRRRRL